jgi:hypothetical protein
MANTKKLCAVILDTLGREVMVRRPCVFGPDGWPAHEGAPRCVDWLLGVTQAARQGVACP